MSERPRTSHLRLVDPDVFVEPDPFAMPVLCNSPTAPVLRVVPRTDAGTGQDATREKPS